MQGKTHHNCWSALANDEKVKRYDDFVRLANKYNLTTTGDGVEFTNPKIDIDEIDEMLKELRG